jgi:hypothetical protein
MSLQPLSDAALAGCVVDGDGQTFAELARRYGWCFTPRVHGRR